jgi:hypothetical protein
MGGARDLPYGVVDVRAEGHAALISIEQRRIHMAWQRGADEKGAALERAQDLIAELACHRIVLR